MHAGSLGQWDWTPSWSGQSRGGSNSFPLARFSVTPKIMKKSIKVTPKKKRGRPATGRDPHVTSRMPPGLIAEVETWATANDTNRSEAIRRLVELGLKIKTPARLISKPGRRLRAQELATKAIDKIIDPAAPPEERAQRRRRLTKGPTEFREARIDQPKARGK
jgi:hypothetical protein